MTRAPRADAPRPLRLWRELAIGLALFGCYVVVDALNGQQRQAAAIQHGRDLLALEQRLHLDVERSLNSWLAGHPVLSTLANYEYAWTYLLSALALLAWVWRRHPELWRTTRDSFVVLNLLAIGCFAAYPTAPPRMLRGLGFVDTVSRGSTVGSWGSGMVDTANQVAAMPSLHVGWALWVSAVLARITARRSVQLVSAVHVLLTAYVIMATANHYLLDAFAVVVPVAVGIRIAEWRHGRPRREEPAPTASTDARRSRGREIVPPADAFFLHVEETGAAQTVGGLVFFAPSAVDDAQPSLAAIRELARTELLPRARFHQRLAPATRWRRPRWQDVAVDVDQHVVERHSTTGLEGVWRAVAEHAQEPLPRDRPLWRILLVRDTDTGGTALLFALHHAMADGLGTITHALQLFRPRAELPQPSGRGPGVLRRGLATLVGLVQLAGDGRARPAGGATSGRDFATAALDLELVRDLARVHGVRVTDVLLAAVAEAVHGAEPGLAARTGGSLRVSVTQLVRAPGATAEGNATAAVMVDVPVDDRPIGERLSAIARTTARLRTPTRAMASRFVMATGLRVIPEPAARRFARAVYGGRYFHAVVSNLPGPSARLSMADTRVDGVFPVLPVAPGAPIALGAMSWAGVYGLGVATDPARISARRLADETARAVDRLAGRTERASSGRWPGEGEEEPSPVAG